MLSTINAKADTPVKIRVDDVNRVMVKVNYVPVSNLVNGLNDVVVPQYGSLTIEAKQGCYLKSVLKTISEENTVTQNITNLTSCNIYLSDADKNKVFTVRSGELASARTALCKVRVDKAAKVRMARYESQSVVELQDGDNNLKWIPNVEKTLVISNANYGDAPIYKVVQDGQDVVASGNQYFITLKEGSTIEVKADYPDVSYPVKFNFSDETAKAVLSKVTVDGVEIRDYTDAAFKLRAGTKLSLTFDQTKYALDAFKVNGVPVSVYGTYDCFVKDKLVFDIQSHKYATIKAALNIDKAANIMVYDGYSYNNQVISLVMGLITLN